MISNRRQAWRIGLAAITVIAIVLFTQWTHGFETTITLAQPTPTPAAAPSPDISPSVSPNVTVSPTAAPLPSPAASPSPTASPMPTASPSPPAPLTTVPLNPSLALPPVPTVPTPPPASIAPPLLLQGEYRDPAGRFRVGLLKDYQVSTIAGTGLIEARDGSLAYTVVAQPQSPSTSIGLMAGVNLEPLLQVATLVFQRGEGFQLGSIQPEAGGGAVINWTGSLTIAGKSQPISGIILARPNPKTILLLLIAATEAGTSQLPGAISALSNSLQPL